MTIVDNLSRRHIDNELEVYSLTPITSMSTRLKTWEDLTGNKVTFVNLDVADNYFRLLKLLEEVLTCRLSSDQSLLENSAS